MPLLQSESSQFRLKSITLPEKKVSSLEQFVENERLSVTKKNTKQFLLKTKFYEKLSNFLSA